MNKLKKAVRPVVAALLTASMLSMSACADNSTKEPPSPSPSDTSAATTAYEDNPAARKQFNTDLDLSPLPINSEITGFTAFFEAEDGILDGTLEIKDDPSASDGKHVVNLSDVDSTLSFVADFPEDGFYTYTFSLKYSAETADCKVLLDGEDVGLITVDSDGYKEYSIKDIQTKKGERVIQIHGTDDFSSVDSLKISPTVGVEESDFAVSKSLVNPYADEHTKSLMSFLCDTYGKYIISGQYGDKGKNSGEIDKLYKLTGKYPAILGLDLIEYSPSRIAHGSNGAAVDYAIQWYNYDGGIVSLCWHWNAPDIYLKNSSEQPWFKGFYSDASTISLDKIMNGEDPEGYDLLMSDIDAIAVQLKRLEEAGVPVLWRPLHEASGGWFWWGKCNAESYKQLWNIMFDKLTNEYKLTNLIWVWNGQNPEWYPGDETVDIIGEDIYAGNRVYTSQIGKFTSALRYTDSTKMVAMTENGCLVDPDAAFADNARWAWFSVWNGEFVVDKLRQLSEEYNEKSMFEKVYSHERVLTLEELPDIKNYPN